MTKNNNSYDAIYFDCDCTLVDIEGLDEMAGFYNKKKAVARLTEKAMSGEVKLEDVFALKLAMIRPKRIDFEKLGKLYIRHVVEDAKEAIDVLNYLHKTVVIMTGNFYPAVSYLSEYLKIKDENVYANNIVFDENENYLTFDTKGPLSVAGGKKSLMLILKRKKRKTVFIGDGLPDALTRPPVDFFIGYGGVITRDAVKEKSDVFIKCRSMSAILPFILSRKEEQIIEKTKYRKLLIKAKRLAEKYTE